MINKIQLEREQKRAFIENSKAFWDSHVQFGHDSDKRDSWFHGVGFDAGVLIMRKDRQELEMILTWMTSKIKTHPEWYKIKTDLEAMKEGKS